MKTSIAIFLIIVISRCEVDAFSFNFSGGFNPGITFGRPHSFQRQYPLRSNQFYEDSVWPQPEHINNYDVSEYLSKPVVNGTGSDDNEKPQTHHGSHHRNRRH